MQPRTAAAPADRRRHAPEPAGAGSFGHYRALGASDGLLGLPTDAGGAGRLNRSSPSCLNRPAQRTAFFHGLLAGTRAGSFDRRTSAPCRSGRGRTRRPPPTLRSRSPAIEDDREGQPGVPPGALRDARRGPGRRCRPEPDIEVVARRPTGATRCRRPSTWPDNRADRHRDAADDRPRACGRTGPPGPVDSRHRADHVRPPQRYLCRALDAAAAGYPLKDAPSASRRRSRSAVRVAGGSRTRQTVWTPSPSLSVGARQICEMPLQAAFADGPDGPGGRCRVGEAGGVRGGPRLSGPRQVCDPGVVHPAGRGGRPTRCRVDGVAAIPAAGDDSIPGDSASGNL